MSPFFKNHKYGGDQQTETQQMIPGQFLFLKEQEGEHEEDRKGDRFLYGF